MAMHHRIAVAQMRSTPVVGDNLSAALGLIKEAAARECAAVFLPEATDYIAEDKAQALGLAQPLSGPFVTALCDAAANHNIYVSVGVHEAPEQPTSDSGTMAVPTNRTHEQSPPTRFFNTQLLINNEGALAGIYRKLHLFDVEIENGPVLMESASTIAGTVFPRPIQTPFASIGQSTCYDIRFPEHSLMHRRLGTTLITYPSAFTVKTGVAHWDVLLRCRAIETQCFVVAAAQVGVHCRKRESYGHAMIVDPWGDVLVDCGTTENTIKVAELDMDRLATMRKDMPVESHRRHDVYALNLVHRVM